MKKRVERLRGMHDLLPDTYQHQRWVTDRLSDFLTQAGYAAVDSPILERSDLFLASFGQELWQNLYAFRLHNRDLCLRPEYTASICRLYLDHYQQQPLPLRFQYAGPIFRYEAPGRNRYRQHTQLGIELLGGHTASADAEMLQLACDMLNELHITRYRLELGHIGVASGFINRLRIRAHSTAQRVGRLSGGNQQKVVLAKWLFRQARVFIFDEPTRGIDVGSKTEIYRLMNQLAESGAAILMVSSELPEILGMADRVLVMRSGRIVKELVAAETNQEEIMRWATLGG